jgi:hypothetical protein
VVADTFQTDQRVRGVNSVGLSSCASFGGELSKKEKEHERIQAQDG